jgi:hypothetical protein
LRRFVGGKIHLYNELPLNDLILMLQDIQKTHPDLKCVFDGDVDGYDDYSVSAYYTDVSESDEEFLGRLMMQEKMHKMRKERAKEEELKTLSRLKKKYKNINIEDWEDARKRRRRTKKV